MCCTAAHDCDSFLLFYAHEPACPVMLPQLPHDLLFLQQNTWALSLSLDAFLSALCFIPAEVDGWWPGQCNTTISKQKIVVFTCGYVLDQAKLTISFAKKVNTGTIQCTYQIPKAVFTLALLSFPPELGALILTFSLLTLVIIFGASEVPLQVLPGFIMCSVFHLQLL